LWLLPIWNDTEKYTGKEWRLSDYSSDDHKNLDPWQLIIDSQYQSAAMPENIGVLMLSKVGSRGIVPKYFH